MPDLHDELAAAAERRQPELLPPFDEVLDARRRRDRRNRIAAGTAAGCLALAGLAVVPGLDRGPEVLGPADDRPTPVADGPFSTTQIDSVRTEPDGRALVAAYIGGACDGTATLAVEESDDQVDIEVRIQPLPGRSGPQVCPAIGIGRTLQANLQAPLGDRVVVSDGRELRVFDGATLLTPRELPEGMTLTSETGSPQGGWTQTYGRRQPAPLSGACEPDARSLSVSIGPGVLQSFDAPHFTDKGEVPVGSTAGRHYVQAGAPVQYLALRVDDTPVALTYSADCGGNAPPLAELVAAAESLEPVTD